MSDKDPIVNETDQPVMPPQEDDINNDQLEQLWEHDTSTIDEDRPAEFTGTLVSLAFIRAAIRRSWRLCCVLAVAGLLGSLVFYAAFPPAYQASTSILLTHPGGVDPTAITDDQTMAQSRTVAMLAMRQLGLQQSISSISSFNAAYTATAVSTRVLRITVSAPSTSQAVKRANAVAVEFLQFRNKKLETQQNDEVKTLNQKINRTRQQITSINNEISQFPKQPASVTERSRLSSLRVALGDATARLTALETSVNATQASTAIPGAVNGSYVLDTAAPIVQSRLKVLLLYGAIGLLLGLVLGLAIVVLRALLSDRVRLRDDVARALGTPVKLSIERPVNLNIGRTVNLNIGGRSLKLKIGRVPQSRRLTGERQLSEADDPGIQRIVAHLGNALPTTSLGPAALAVVPVDDPYVAALSTMSLAVSCAQHGKRVVVADLAKAAPAARLVAAGQPGVRTVSVHGARLTVAVPDESEDVDPDGPLDHVAAQPHPSSFTEAVTAASASADLLLTLVTLDPSLGADHLPTWATDAVALVTAGRSSAARVQAVGEMIRLSGTHLASAVLIGADKTDDSLGATYASAVGRNGAAAEGGSAF